MTSPLSNARVRESAVRGKDWNAPLLITGCARSGTTALTRALSGHDNFCIFNEYHLYYQSEYEFNIWHRIQRMRNDNPPPIKISSDTASLKSKLLEEMPLPAACPSTRNWLFSQVDKPVKVYGDKMPYKYLETMPEVVENFPDVKFLIVLRDGRDVVTSQIRRYEVAIENNIIPAHWMQPTVQEAEYLWLRSVTTWLKLRSDPQAPCLEVRYEQATESPETLAREICDFVGINYREEDFRRFLKQYRPVHIDTWRNEINGIESQLSSEFLDALDQLGYR